MRVRVLTLSLALVIGGSTIGCKSAPKLPWFSSADKAAPGAATATTASTAPQLPSQIAKQAESLASTEPVRITTAPASTTAKSAGGTAPAYTATSMPGSYPTTGAQDYLSNSAAALKSAASTNLANTAAAAKASLPYDPAAVPPSATAAASTPANSLAATADRYGMSSQDRYANAYPASTPAYTPGSFPTSTAPNATQAPAAAPNAPATSSVPYASNPSSASIGDRYAAQSTPTTSPVGTAAVPSYSAPVQPASAVASLQPYRPGGTGSYPGTSANYEVATKPGSTSTSTAPSGTLYR